MSYPITVMPDPVQLLQQYLKSKSVVTDLVNAANIVTEIPINPTFPLVVLANMGGTGYIAPGIDAVGIQVDVYGGTKFACGVLARTIEAACWSIANDVVAAGTLVSSSSEMSPSWLPDQVTVPPTPRYTARYHFIFRP